MIKDSIQVAGAVVGAVFWGSIYFACLAVVRRPTLVVPRGK
jgi:hypothetical protein